MNLSAIQIHPRKSTGWSLAPASIRGIRRFFSPCSSQTPAIPDADPRSGRPRSGGLKSKFLAVTVFLSPVLAILGCQHIGPPTIAHDRLAYNDAILTSWKQQALLNIVRIRYDDLVGFVDVGPVVQAHSVVGTTGASFGASVFPQNPIGTILSPSLMGSRTTTDSPNITYTPLAGSDFARNISAPIKPVDIFCNLIESGYEADALMDLTVDFINDIPGTIPGVNKFTRIRSPNFIRVTNAIKDAHKHGDISFYAQAVPDSDVTKVFMIIPEQDSKPCQDCLSDKYPVATIREVLRLKAAVTKFEIVPGSRPTKETEIAVRTRSVIGAMKRLSDYVRVPEPQLKDVRYPNLAENDDFPRRPRPLTVEATVKKPSDPFAAIPYRGYWFSISQGDYRSKFSLIYLRILLALADTGARPTAPVLTIPTR
jgi:hypothetical protein